jgi:hypothetical protein
MSMSMSGAHIHVHDHVNHVHVSFCLHVHVNVRVHVHVRGGVCIHVPVAATPVERFLARWRRRRGEYLEVVLVTSLVI